MTAAATGRVAELEAERDALFEELGLAYESLSSVFELAGDPALLLDPDRALERVLERACAVEPGLRACFWLTANGRAIPACCAGATARERDASRGLLGRVLSQGRAFVTAGPGDAGEPELARATRVAFLPLLRGARAFGALAVWREDEGVFDSRLVGLWTALASFAAMVLEQDRLRTEILQGERLRRDVAIGGEIQRTLLVGDPPADAAGFEIGCVAEASGQVDGDFLGFLLPADGVLDVLVGDVMGKGIPAALVGAAVKSEFLRFAETRGADGVRRAPPDPAAVVGAVHGATVRKLIGLGRFVTAVYARIDANAGLFTWVDAGHPPPLLLPGGAAARACRAEPAGVANLPLGSFPDTSYEGAAVPCAPGDVICLYSDGLSEAADEAGTQLGADGIARLLETHRDLPARELAASIRDAAAAHAAGDLRDDVTCIVVRVLPPPRVLELDAVPRSLSACRSFVAEACAWAGGFDEDEVARLQLGITEAASNVVRHAYGGAGGPLRVEARCGPDALRFRLVDRGTPFDPASVPPPDFGGDRAGGFGVYLMGRIFDEVAYARDPDGTNRLDLVRRRGERT